ncbi:MAG: glycosyltransferase family 4 protein [candidate division WOR-3 bacterium]
MKILFINTSPYAAGSFIADVKLAKLLAENGFEVFFSTYLDSYRKYYTQLSFLKFKFLDVLKLIKQVDVIFLTESKARNLCTLVRILNPKARIFSVRRTKPKSTKISIKLQDAFCDKILCVSEDIANHINSKKTYIIYDFVESLNSPKEKLNFPLVFGYIGRNDYDKGVDILLKAYKLKRFKLVLAGNFENSEFLKYDVEHLGFINDISLFFNKIDVLILPSRKEGLPRVILESFSFGIPVIASNVGGVPEVVKENYNGFLFESENVYELLEKINLLEKNPKIILQISNNCIKTIEEKFLKHHMLERILNVLK